MRQDKSQDKENNSNNEIPEMELNNKYKEPVIKESPEKIEKEMEKTKKELDKIKNFIVKKYPYALSISILPPQAIPRFIEEEEVPKETEKHIHMNILIPEEKSKEIQKIKQETVKLIESLKQKIWLHIHSPNDLWEICLDSKFELMSAVAVS